MKRKVKVVTNKSMLQMVGCKYKVFFFLLEIADSFIEVRKLSLAPRKPERTSHGYENHPRNATGPLPPIDTPAEGRMDPPFPRNSHFGRERLPVAGRVSHPSTSFFFKNIPPQGI